jgi:hypothetical protein
LTFGRKKRLAGPGYQEEEAREEQKDLEEQQAVLEGLPGWKELGIVTVRLATQSRHRIRLWPKRLGTLAE